MAKRIKFEEGHASFVEWKVVRDSRVTPGQVLLVYKSASGATKRWKCHDMGLVTECSNVTYDPGDNIDPGSLWIQLAECEHPVVMKDMCADCGKDLKNSDGIPGERSNNNAKVAMIHSIPELQISAEEARTHGLMDEKHVLDNRKLVLLVDLDQTLLHTTNEQVDPNLEDVHHYQLYGTQSPWYHTRLRPHTHAFLQNISKLYQLHICTFGARMYAHTIAKIIDPEGTLFGHRILSRDECFDPQLKTANLKALFPCGDRLVCIIDDREDVWDYAENVVHVKPYRYFHHTGDINAPPNMVKGESTEEEQCKTVSDSEDEDYLLRLESVLTSIHSAFYQLHDQNAQPQPNLKAVISYVRRKVLKNLRIVLSSIIPTTIQAKDTQIHRAVHAFGAIVQEDVIVDGSEGTTHVVAAKWGTSKVLRAQQNNTIFIVKPGWLWSCIQRWERVNEQEFVLKAKDGSIQVPDARKRLNPAPQCASQTSEKLEVAEPEQPKQTADKCDPHYDLCEDVVVLDDVELECMSAEVEDALSDESQDEEDKDGQASSDESLSNDHPRGWKRKNDVTNEQGIVLAKTERKEENDSSSSSSGDADSIGSIDQEMVDALEKEMA